MRLRRRAGLHAVGDRISDHDIPVLQAETEALRANIHHGLREFRLSTEVALAQIDTVYDKLSQKAATLRDKAKADIGNMAKARELQIDAAAASKLLKIEHRLSSLQHRSERGTTQHHEHQLATFFSELQRMNENVNSIQMDFKLQDECKAFLKSCKCIGKPRINQRKLRRVQPDLHLFHNDRLFTPIPSLEDLNSLSSSNNVSLSSVDFSSDAIDDDTARLKVSSDVTVSAKLHNPACGSGDVISERTQNDFVVAPANDLCLFDDGLEYQFEQPYNIPNMGEDDTCLKEIRDLNDTRLNSSITQSIDLSCENNAYEDEQSSNVLMKTNGASAQGTHIQINYVTEFQTIDHRGACVIPDIALLANHTIAIADHYHNNMQFYDSDFQLIAEVKCPYPMSVCVVDDTTVAVSLRRSIAIALYRVEGNVVRKLTELSVRCSVYIWNTICKAGHLFVVCDRSNVHVLALDGTDSRVIKPGIGVEKGYIRYFDVSDDGKRIYLCEGLGKSLRCIDADGTHLWSLDSSDIPVMLRSADNYFIEDVCLINGRLLATNLMQSKVFEISLDGKYVSDLINTDLDSPRAMSVAGNRLVVTQFSPNMQHRTKRTVKVFNIQS